MERPKWTAARRFLLAALLVPAAAAGPAQAGGPPPDLILVLDASGSMWGQIRGENKIVIARRVLGELIGKLPDDARVALVAYGHRAETDCGDVETVVPLGPLNRELLSGRIETLDPKGKTPITRAVREAFTIARGGSGAVVVLVSDGLETCNEDPCRAVADGKADGIDFVLHVVGFDVGAGEVSQLECAAQAGGGLYFGAEDGGELAAALDKAVAPPADLPGGRLSIRASANGELTDVLVRVFDGTTGLEVAKGRTYASPRTNPRIFPLPAGSYDVEALSVEMDGDVGRSFVGIVIGGGGIVEKTVEIGAGELGVKVTRNGMLSDAVVGVYESGSSHWVTQGRTYVSEGSNPIVFHLTPGSYDVEIKAIEIDGKPSHRMDGLTVVGGERIDRGHDFQSGTIRVAAVDGAELVDCTVGVTLASSNAEVDRRRTYTSPESNPATFEVPPGDSRLIVKAVGRDGRPAKQLDVTVEAGRTAEALADFSE
jgi:Ca-activated chloride channel family protein